MNEAQAQKRTQTVYIIYRFYSHTHTQQIVYGLTHYCVCGENHFNGFFLVRYVWSRLILFFFFFNFQAKICHINIVIWPQADRCQPQLFKCVRIFEIEIKLMSPIKCHAFVKWMTHNSNLMQFQVLFMADVSYSDGFFFFL